MQQFDVIVIGAGAAGSMCVEKVNEAGLSVALIERDALGGTCLNYGCDPTKTALRTAKISHDARNSQKRGIHISEVSVNWWGIIEHIHSVQDTMLGGSEAEAREQMRERGINLIMGEASFVSPHEVKVNGRTHRADHIVLATGTKALIPDISGLKEAGYVTNKTVFKMPLQPTSLAIIGGGPIGVEFAQLFARLGTKVHLIEAEAQILPKDDPELASELEAVLLAEGVDVMTQAEVTAVSATSAGKVVTIAYESGYQEEVVVGEILVAVGRKAVFSSLNLEVADVEVQDGQIKTNDALQTSVPHIWSAGDVTSPYQFTHVANKQGTHVAQNIINGSTEPFDAGPVPWVTYTDPELAHVGKTAVQLDEEGIAYRMVNFNFDKIARAITIGQTEGRIKLFVDEEDQILGGHVLAAHGGELLGPIILAMKQGISATALAEAIWPYPTMSEAIGRVAQEVAS